MTDLSSITDRREQMHKWGFSDQDIDGMLAATMDSIDRKILNAISRGNDRVMVKPDDLLNLTHEIRSRGSRIVAMEAQREAVLAIHTKELDRRKGGGEILYINVCHCCGDDYPCATVVALGGETE